MEELSLIDELRKCQVPERYSTYMKHLATSTSDGFPVFAGSLSPTWCGMVSAISLNHSKAAPLQSNVGFKVGDGRNN